VFEDNQGDAIDYDFMEGEIRGNYFNNNGNDAMDTSESVTRIMDNVVEGAGDKCLSIGERSNVVVINNLFKSCKVGVEVKDLSEPVLINNVITGNEIGINSYQKKEIFGGGHGKIYNTLLVENLKEIAFVNIDDGDLIEGDDSDIEIYNSNVPGWNRIKNQESRIKSKGDSEGFNLLKWFVNQDTNMDVDISVNDLEENDWMVVGTELEKEGDVDLLREFYKEYEEDSVRVGLFRSISDPNFSAYRQ